MKVKDAHIRLLNQGREGHAKRIEELRKQIALHEEEIDVHEVILTFSENPRLVEFLNGLSEQPASTFAAQDRVKKSLADIGVALPPDAEVHIGAIGRRSMRAEIFMSSGNTSYRMTWDSMLGFSAKAVEA